jgi:predicted ATPase
LGDFLVLIENEKLYANGVDEAFFHCFVYIFSRIRDKLGFNIDGGYDTSDYLPAARSGILPGHKVLVSDIIKKASYAGIEKFDIPKYSGVVSDLLSSLIELTDEEGPLFDLTREFEQELIGGEVVISTISDYTAPDIKYRFSDKEISMHRSSSTVKELAPLFLYLKYKVAPGSLLIIEEPEAHLHPENQRILAKLLVRLIRKGVKLLITTHSDYLLDQLSSFIMLSRAKSKKQREELNFNKDDYLKPDEIGVHVFQFDKKSKGYKIEEVEISTEDGISEEEFLKVNEALYEESIKIREKIEAQKG